MKRGFSLIELLVVTGILAVLLSVLMPALAGARRQAKVVAVNADLYQIGLALEAYGHDHRDRFPPTRTSCMLLEHHYQLPSELADGGYLPDKPDETAAMSSGYEDRYNPAHTYKYLAVGTMIMNGNLVIEGDSKLWIPDGFPDAEMETGKKYNNPGSSPVTWVVYSLGPNYDQGLLLENHYPVSVKSWYSPEKGRGILSRVRLKDSRHVGTFERQGE